MKTAGLFLSKYIVSQKMTPADIQSMFDFDFSDGRALLVVSVFVGLGTSGHKDLIPVDSYKALESMDHDTQTLMSFYDLEDIMAAQTP